MHSNDEFIIQSEICTKIIHTCATNYYIPKIHCSTLYILLYLIMFFRFLFLSFHYINLYAVNKQSIFHFLCCYPIRLLTLLMPIWSAIRQKYTNKLTQTSEFYIVFMAVNAEQLLNSRLIVSNNLRFARLLN